MIYSRYFILFKINWNSLWFAVNSIQHCREIWLIHKRQDHSRFFNILFTIGSILAGKNFNAASLIIEIRNFNLKNYTQIFQFFFFCVFFAMIDSLISTPPSFKGNTKMFSALWSICTYCGWTLMGILLRCSFFSSPLCKMKKKYTMGSRKFYTSVCGCHKLGNKCLSHYFQVVVTLKKCSFFRKSLHYLL